MHRTRLSLVYLFSYLIIAGVALLADPRLALSLLGSNGDYGVVMPRLLGVMLLSLGLIILQIFRHRIDALYTTTLLVRSLILPCLVWLYLHAGDPMFLVLVGVVGFGFVLTGLSWWRDRR